jgi:hypothetical protein
MNALLPIRESFLERHRLLIRRAAGVISGLGFLAIVLGCMNIQLGGGTVATEDALTFSQRGSISASAGQEVDVYYPVPYASPPNLVIEDFTHNYSIIDQKSDHFRVRNNGLFAPSCDWTARGVKVAIPGAAPESVAPFVPVSTLPKQ